jgi:hypothetical protein
MPPERRTLMDIWSKGKFKTSSDLPTLGQAWGAYEKKFQKGVTEGGKNIFGQKVGPLKSEDLQSMVMGVAGGGAQIGKGAAKWGINRMLQVAEKGQPSRSVVAVQMSKGGKEWLQPFYKSSGTSIPGAGKRGKWMPFMGKQTRENLPGSPAGKRFFKDTYGETTPGMGKDWWVKGWSTAKDKWRYAGGKGYDQTQHAKSAVGPYGNISSEISRLEKTGYFKHAGTAKTSKQVNKWLEGYGFDRPRSMSW